MPETPKRKRLDKLPDKSAAAPTYPPSVNTYCCRCGRAYSRKKGYFPVSHSPMYRGSGHLPWCNECVDQMFAEYKQKFGDQKKAMYRMCMKLDLYWSESIYEMVERQAGVDSFVRTYIGKTNLLRFIDKSFDDTLREEGESSRVLTNAEATTDPEITQATIDFWGAGYTPDFYADLERRYQEWTGGAEIVDPSERSLYRNICISEVLINRDVVAGRQPKDNVNSLNQLLGSMNLKPAQRKNDTDGELEKMPLGVGIEKWENRRPLPETAPELRDVSHRIKDITTWYLGHGAKMVNLRNGHVQLYEEAMNALRVKFPEYEDEDDDTLLTDIFGNSKAGVPNG